MSNLEDRLRDEYRSLTTHAEARNPARLNQVRARVARNARRRFAAVAGAGLLALGALVGGLQVVDRASDPAVTDDSTPASASRVISELLSGAQVPTGFDAARIDPLGDLFATDRATAVTGVAQAVACAWTSQYAADARGPSGREAVEALALSDEWSLLQAIAADNDYPSRVASIAADLLRSDLRSSWRSYLRCNTYPGDSNLS